MSRKKLEEEFGELGKDIGRFIDLQAHRIRFLASKSHITVVETIEDLEQTRVKVNEIIESIGKRIQEKIDSMKDQDPIEVECKNKARSLYFNAPIQVHGREGFFIGQFADAIDPDRPYSTIQYQVALSVLGKAYATVVTLKDITVKG